MNRSEPCRPGPKAKAASPSEAAASVRKHALKLFDRQDGRTADWPLIAQTLFAAAFQAIDEMPGDRQMRSVLRRVEASVYNRLAGNADDGLPDAVRSGLMPPPDVKPPRAPQPNLKPAGRR